MKTVSRTIRVAFVVLALGTTVALAVGSPASATTAKPAPHAAPHAAPTVTPDSPSGCLGDNFCSYNSGNGGSLCFQSDHSLPLWAVACSNHNDGAYNRNANSVNLYYYIQYEDAYSTLYSGNYWLYMSKNYFAHCNDTNGSCTGKGQAMQNNVMSDKFN